MLLFMFEDKDADVPVLASEQKHKGNVIEVNFSQNESGQIEEGTNADVLEFKPKQKAPQGPSWQGRPLRKAA